MPNKPHTGAEPETDKEWQDAVDAAAGARAMADCMMYGLITGPQIDVDRCDDLLARGAARGVTPSLPAYKLAIGLALGMKAERGACCTLCHGTGKVDRGNGTTKPCECTRRKPPANTKA